jgi:hypothetical protein
MLGRLRANLKVIMPTAPLWPGFCHPGTRAVAWCVAGVLAACSADPATPATYTFDVQIKKDAKDVADAQGAGNDELDSGTPDTWDTVEWDVAAGVDADLDAPIDASPGDVPLDDEDESDAPDVADVVEVVDLADVTDVTDVTDVADVKDVMDVPDAADTKDTAEVTDVKDVKDVPDVQDAGDEPWWDPPDADTGTVDVAQPVWDSSNPPSRVCSPVANATPVEETVSGGGKLDILFWIDTSGSMTEEAKWLTQNLQGFADFIAKKGIDYNLMVMGTGLGLCSPKCFDPAPNHFWNKIAIASTNGPTKFLSSYNTYEAFLRDDAKKNIVAVTDDNSSMTADNFKANLLAKPKFKDGFVHHSIVAFNEDAKGNLLPGMCNTGASVGTVYLKLTQDTGGSRFKVCDQNWVPMFEKLAANVAKTVSALCTYAIPPVPGKNPDLQQLQLSYFTGKEVVEPLKHVADATACDVTPNGWFFDDNAMPSKVIVCDTTCQGMIGGKIVFQYGCL